MSKVYHDGARTGAYVVGEAEIDRSRERIIVGIGNVLESGTVLAQLGTGSALVTPKAGNTGNGVLTVDATTPVLAGAKPGNYVVTMTAATAFTVENPEGVVIGNGAAGVTFADGVKFVLAAGGTAHVAGDAFSIAVTPGDLKFKAFAVGDTPAAILFAPVDASEADAAGVAHVRACSVSGHELIWPEAITENQRIAAEAALGNRGIIVRF